MINSCIPIVPPYTGNRIFHDYMDSIANGPGVNLDTTMVATMRCLLDGRTKEKFSFINNAIYEQLLTEYLLFKENCIGYYVIKGKTSEAGISGALKNIEETKWNNDDGIERLIQVEEHIKKRLSKPIRIYTKKKTNSVIIIVPDFNFNMLHLVESFLTVLLVNVFKDQPPTKEELEMLETLTKSNKSDYLAKISKLASGKPFYQKTLENALANIEKKNMEDRLHSVAVSLDAARRRANDILTEYTTMLEQIKEYTISYEGVQNILRRTGESTDLIDYFKAHKNIKLVNIEDSQITIIINTYLDSFDVEGYQHIGRFDDIYKHYHLPKEFAGIDDVKLFMNSIFNEDPILKIKMCGVFQLGLNGRITSFRDYDYCQHSECEHYIPNPHLQIHNCLSRNAALIAEQLNKGEIIGAIECCHASAMSVDIHETSQTFRPMMDWIFNNGKKIVHNMKTGEDMTTIEALAWLKENKK